MFLELGARPSPARGPEAGNGIWPAMQGASPPGQDAAGASSSAGDNILRTPIHMVHDAQRLPIRCRRHSAVLAARVPQMT